ncbi:MAG TPA: rhodanese-like domain-containing protein [Bacteriovoracaceae bacterium]|nr:rhodanese-like domain-containing protein [Bacteriovoracaceae bacterium]
MSDNQITLLDLHETFKKMGPGEVVLDVRNPDEFKAGHIPNAINIPVTEVANRSKELESFKKVYIHCKRGGRAKTAFEALRAKGLNNTICVHDAGMDLWIEKGFPISH